MVRRARQRLLHPAARRARRRARLRPGHALGEAPGQGPGRDPAGSPHQGARPPHQPLRAGAVLLDQLRGRHPLHRASAQRGRERHEPRAVRGVHARGPLPGLRRHPPEARLEVGHDRRAAQGPRQRPRQEHRGGVCAADQRGRRLPRRPRAVRPGAADRRARAQGDPGAAAVPARRGSRLPLPRPALGDAVRRRGPADPAGHPDRRRARGRPLRPRRAEHRPAPARQPTADRDPGPAEEPRQHPDRGRARRGDHQDRRLGGRHRPRGRRARRPGGPLGHGQAAAQAPRLRDRALPLRAQVDPGARRTPPADQEPDAHRARGAREQPQGHRRQLPARLLREPSPASRGRASRRWSTTSSTPRWPSRSTTPAPSRAGTARSPVCSTSTR